MKASPNERRKIKFGLAAKLNLILSLVFFLSVCGFGFLLSSIFENGAKAEVEAQALIVNQFANATRSYTQEHITPLLQQQLQSATQFTSEAIPAAAARQTFDFFRDDEPYNDFFYKAAADNPTNPRDRADEFEMALLERFRSENAPTLLSGIRNFGPEEFFYVAQPLKLNNPSCLECHSIPANAPASLIASYGSENGFGWQLNSVIATQIVSVPYRQIADMARHRSIQGIAVLAAILILILLILNILLSKVVVQPILKIARTAQLVASEDNLDVEFPFEKSNNEFGVLSRAISSMIYGLKTFAQELEYRDRAEGIHDVNSIEYSSHSSSSGGESR
ncbi:DUF3365 domain-containing protein [Oculatella sp. LEGE 06141]|uniref:Tll0287-like domain-containing protein n=1 Tax=Oculatella sp. LEGE 06141 TaxID=1828648 RepID=UPI00187F6036|nr:DUF3365 domain-containing protein [Oculatella sp. LEGE 06141]MBE9180201.1 DUF3365 domain-containing protein [Oculatella sp. LEGE 06141]